MRVAEKGLALQIKADDLNRKHADLLFMSPLAPLYGRKALERDLLPEIVDRLLSFEVNDPYETCFAFLCLVDEGSDAAWLYNTNLAVLSAAARKLPWADNIFTPEDYDEWDDTDEVHPDSEYKADSPHDPVELSNVPIDWNNKKTRLYELKYKDDVAFFPDKSDRKDWKLNIPQMVYSLTDLVMPRTVSDYDNLPANSWRPGWTPQQPRYWSYICNWHSISSIRAKTGARFFNPVVSSKSVSDMVETRLPPKRITRTPWM